MSTTPRLVPFLLFAGACGAPEPPAIQVEDAIAQLVPEEAYCLLWMPSLDAADASRARLEEVGPTPFPDIGANMVRELGVDAALIDRTRPFAAAFLLDEAGDTLEIAIVPATDTEALAAALSAENGAHVAGGYVGVAPDGPYTPSRGRPAIAMDLLAGDVALRLDLRRLVEAHREAIEDSFAEMEEQSGGMLGLGDALQGYFSFVRALVDSSGTLDAALRLGESEWEIAAVFTAREGSPLAEIDWGDGGDPLAMAPYVDPDKAMLVLMSLDVGKLMAWSSDMMSGLMSMIPGNLDEYMENLEDLIPLYGDSVAMAMDMGPGGMRSTYVAASGSPEELMGGMTVALGDIEALGMVFEERPGEEIAGVDVRRFDITVDPEALAALMGGQMEENEFAQAAAMQAITMLYGAEGMRYGLAADDDRLLMAMGGDPAWLEGTVDRFANGGARVPADLARMADRVGGGSATFLLRIQVARLMNQFVAMFTGMMGVPPEANERGEVEAEVPIVLGVGIEGRTWRASLSLDPAALAAFVEAAKDL